MLADWDARLLTPERALQLAGDWPVYASAGMSQLSQFGSQPDQGQVNLRCGRCHQSCGLLGTFTPDDRMPHGLAAVKQPLTSIGDLLSAVVRHMVTAHDLSLSGAPNG